ncbi:MAG: NFACT family protein [Clostridia bacterium]|nr:NFACT family protein [Clostridia bacterium]
MALDAIFLKYLLNEIKQTAFDARVEKIYQPSRDDLVLALRGRSFAGKLFITANPGMPRLHFTKYAPENPSTPPMLCMLLRKKLTGARLVDIRQDGLERIAYLDFDATNELGDRMRLTVVVEIMARYSNIILIDENSEIIDSVRRVDHSMSAVRQIMPGMIYVQPPKQDKLSIFDLSPGEIANEVLLGKSQPLSKKLLSVMQGVSPIVCRELSFEVDPNDIQSGQLDKKTNGRLKETLESFRNRLSAGDIVPVMAVAADTHRPIDFSFMPIGQYGSACEIRRYDSFSELLDEFYSERDRQERTARRAQDLFKLIGNLRERCARKIDIQQAELQNSENREEKRVFGDLLTANLYRMEKGMLFIDVENYYDPEGPTVRIPLDPAKTPNENAQKYYRDYRKAQTAERILTEQIKKAQDELQYLDSVYDALTRADTERELNEIKSELSSQGYIRHSLQRRIKSAPSKPIEFISSDGFRILIGRNNIQNDSLTLKTARNNDIWFHTKDIAGSHTVVVSEGRAVPDSTLNEAAILAALFSSAGDMAKVPVDYTAVKNVKKPVGAKPGMVIYNDYKTAYVIPDRSIFDRVKAAHI